MGLTDKQKSILLKGGFHQDAVDSMQYEEASRLIGEIIAKKPANKYVKTLPAPQTTFIEKPGYKRPEMDKKSFYVAYAKDLVVAGKTPDEALAIIKQFREAFE